jgi:hypothetical protein
MLAMNHTTMLVSSDSNTTMVYMIHLIPVVHQLVIILIYVLYQ